jgi:hypothetical protein
MLATLGGPDAAGQVATPEQMTSAMKQYRADLHRAVRSHWAAPPGLAPDETCRFAVVQRPGGELERVEFVDCRSKAFQRSVLEAVARTALPRAPQFPQDGPALRSATVLEFRSRDVR